MLTARPAARRLRHRPGQRRSRLEGCCTSPAATAAKPSARACSALYKGDARQLVLAGLVGGKGIPESVAAHPCVFATLTAPSFGPVHARRMRGKTVLPCRPRRDSKDRRCPHGRDISCPVRHGDQDPRLGRPLCGDCYDYEAAVLFNFHAGTLFRRFTTYLPRHLARLAGVTRKRLRADLRIRFVKVAEYQARGVIHFHAVIRLDAPGNRLRPAPGPLHRRTLVRRHHAGRPRRPHRRPARPRPPAHPARLRPPDQSDPIWRQPFVASGQPLDVEAVANYIAKYATKSADVPGLPDTRIRHAAAIGALRCSAHHKRMIATAWQLGCAQATGDPRLRLWAHMLGYGGHFLTKSRRYAVTFGYIRGERATTAGSSATARRRTRPLGPAPRRHRSPRHQDWTYAGRGYAPRTLGAQLALASADLALGHDHSTA